MPLCGRERRAAIGEIDQARAQLVGTQPLAVAFEELVPEMASGEVRTLLAKFGLKADHVMRAAMSKLFRDEPDVRNLIKMKAIYEILETVTDRCEDVANIIEGIIVENA